CVEFAWYFRSDCGRGTFRCLASRDPRVVAREPQLKGYARATRLDDRLSKPGRAARLEDGKAQRHQGREHCQCHVCLRQEWPRDVDGPWAATNAEQGLSGLVYRR